MKRRTRAKTKARGSGRWRRILLWGVLILALAAPFLALATYTAAARWLLSGPKLRELINVRSKDFLLDYDAATSDWPGYVTIRNLRLRGSDPHVQWFATISDVELEYSVPALIRRSFQCTLRGTGVSFSLRGKLSPQDAKTSAASFLPPIPGFADPPLKSPEDVFFVDPRPWSIDLRHVTLARLEDIWVNGVRYRGRARVEGGLFLKPLYLVRIDAAALRLGRGDLRIGPAEGLTVSGVITVLTKPFAPLRTPMPGALREFSATLKLDLRTSRLEALQDLFAPPAGLKIEGGAATATIDAGVEAAIATGKVAIAVRKGAVRIPQYRLQGDASLEVPLRRWDLMKGPFDVSGTRLALTDVHSSGPEEARGWWGKVEIPSGRVGATTVAKVGMSCRDARPLLAFLGVAVPGWVKPLVNLEDFKVSANVAAAPTALRMSDFDADGGGFHIEGDYARERAGNGAFLISKGLLILGIEIEQNKTTVRPLFAKQWYEKRKETAASAGTGPK